MPQPQRPAPSPRAAQLPPDRGGDRATPGESPPQAWSMWARAGQAGQLATAPSPHLHGEVTAWLLKQQTRPSALRRDKHTQSHSF